MRAYFILLKPLFQSIVIYCSVLKGALQHPELPSLAPIPVSQQVGRSVGDLSNFHFVGVSGLAQNHYNMIIQLRATLGTLFAHSGQTFGILIVVKAFLATLVALHFTPVSE